MARIDLYRDNPAWRNLLRAGARAKEALDKEPPGEFLISDEDAARLMGEVEPMNRLLYAIAATIIILTGVGFFGIAVLLFVHWKYGGHLHSAASLLALFAWVMCLGRCAPQWWADLRYAANEVIS